ncbi:hypothetical protein ARMSODRAFT_172976 [Armillaria solidipes]|uniref:Uncharacterized protein n=1 Tax=Armillaria solidipes TaxID=1076256 RepID=A0A2H3BSN4_9AGAR|nr:hypothetical protein ARMSODRAFT_172976 [Armillaria solidipes]
MAQLSRAQVVLKAFPGTTMVHHIGKIPFTLHTGIFLSSALEEACRSSEVCLMSYTRVNPQVDPAQIARTVCCYRSIVLRIFLVRVGMSPTPLTLFSGVYLAAKKDRRVALISLFPEIRMNEPATPTQKRSEANSAPRE